MSRVLNPFAIGAGAILLLSFESTNGPAPALRWAAAMMALGLLPVLVAAIYLVRSGRMEGILTASRRQRTGIYLLAIACTGAGYVLLLYTDAPPLLLAAFAGGLVGTILFAGINTRWKISLHTGVAAALAAILIMLYGPVGIIAVVPVMVVGWSRLELRQHSPAQAVAGTLLASAVVVAVFRLFDLP
jgi:membrane-associated phospholipid phosphatase